MTSATIGRKSAASCLNRLQRPFDAASTRYRQTEALLAGGGSRTEAEAALHAAHTAVTFRAGALAAQDRVARPARPPAAGGAGRSAVPTEGSTSPVASLGLTRRGRRCSRCWLRPHQQVTPARPVTCTTRGPAGRADSSLDDTQGQVRSGSDPPAGQVHDQDPSCILTGQITGMRSDTAVRRRRAEATATERNHGRAFPQVNPGAVGLAGLEPAASSLSGIEGSALCGQPFPRSSASVGGEGMRSYWPLHATRQVHDDVQLAGYTWVLLAGVRDAAWSPWPAPPSSCRAWMDEPFPAASLRQEAAVLSRPANRSVLLGAC